MRLFWWADWKLLKIYVEYFLNTVVGKERHGKGLSTRQVIWRLVFKSMPHYMFFSLLSTKTIRHRFNENAFITFKPRMTLETLWRETRYEPITLINFDGIGRRNSYGKIDDRNFLNRFEIAYKFREMKNGEQFWALILFLIKHYAEKKMAIEFTQKGWITVNTSRFPFCGNVWKIQSVRSQSLKRPTALASLYMG